MSGGGTVSCGKPPANGLVTSDRNELIARIPVGATAVAACPESCSSEFVNWAGVRVLRATNGSGTVGAVLSVTTIGTTTGGTTGETGGTGTTAVVHGAKLPADIWLVSNVTAPCSAKALPQAMLAPVVNVMLCCAR